jgi:hypothetical protein
MGVVADGDTGEGGSKRWFGKVSAGIREEEVLNGGSNDIGGKFFLLFE